jgi:hypothetical protein
VRGPGPYEKDRVSSRYPQGIVTSKRLALVLLVALVAASVWVSAGSPSTPILRVVLVVISGKGKVTSSPKGIACPHACRGLFPKDALVHLTAQPAAGWRVLSYAGWCRSKQAACAFNLTTQHDCSSKVCAVGAFGVQVLFAKR